MLSLRRTIEEEEVGYWFDQRHKCWLRVVVKRSDLMSTKPIYVTISGNPELLDFNTYRQMFLNRSDIEFFNINPNDNLCLNVEYYKYLHWYNWRMKFKYKRTYTRPGVASISNMCGPPVFVF